MFGSTEPAESVGCCFDVGNHQRSPPSTLFLIISQSRRSLAKMEAIAQQFTDFYYSTFDTDRAQLVNLYVRSQYSIRGWRRQASIMEEASYWRRINVLPSLAA